MQVKWMVSIWNANLGWNVLQCNTIGVLVPFITALLRGRADCCFASRSRCSFDCTFLLAHPGEAGCVNFEATKERNNKDCLNNSANLKSTLIPSISFYKNLKLNCIHRCFCGKNKSCLNSLIVIGKMNLWKIWGDKSSTFERKMKG